MKYLLGYDIGSSSVKVALVAAGSGRVLASAGAPSVEMPIAAPQMRFAEQDPDRWWLELKNATAILRRQFPFASNEVLAIGISYQMHGLVLVDKNHKPLRPALIWCDSRAVEIGEEATKNLGEAYCLEHYLNAVGNFTASKMAWVIRNEAAIFEKTWKMLLPGDYIALRLTGEASTTTSGLSEGIMWDFKNRQLATRLLEYYGFREAVVAPLVPTFGEQGFLTAAAALELGLEKGTPISYRAGDQPNNAFSLNVLNVGEVAATAGTSGVVYGISDQKTFDPKSRVNTFVHVNDSVAAARHGVLLCINGTGILNSWLRRMMGAWTYEQMNTEGSKTPIGAEGLVYLPFGNGAERVLENRQMGAQMMGLNFNTHHQGHLCRAAQEGIVYALNYGFEIMKTLGVSAQTVRAGLANMFLSPLFREAFANTTGAMLELYNTDGAVGAARGAGIGIGFYKNFDEAFVGLARLAVVEPQAALQAAYTEGYQNWLSKLDMIT
jgi:xylulokinase